MHKKDSKRKENKHEATAIEPGRERERNMFIRNLRPTDWMIPGLWRRLVFSGRSFLSFYSIVVTVKRVDSLLLLLCIKATPEMFGLKHLNKKSRTPSDEHDTCISFNDHLPCRRLLLNRSLVSVMAQNTAWAVASCRECHALSVNMSELILMDENGDQDFFFSLTSSRHQSIFSLSFYSWWAKNWGKKHSTISCRLLCGQTADHDPLTKASTSNVSLFWFTCFIRWCLGRWTASHRSATRAATATAPVSIINNNNNDNNRVSSNHIRIVV